MTKNARKTSLIFTLFQLYLSDRATFSEPMTTPKVLLLSAIAFFCSTAGNAQGLSYFDSIPVTVNSNTLKFPWCGGLNYPQMYRIDLNGDGMKDLFIYEKSTAKHRTYINTGGVGDYPFVYAPQYEWRFPRIFDNWVQLFDFNCDGKEDIFTYNNGFIQVWRNDYNTQNGLTFSLYINVLYATFMANGYDNLLISSQTHPAFSDVDYDGDLDLLIYGITVDWFQNMAQENFGRCDTLVFTEADQCWGKFSSFGNPLWNVLTFNTTCRSMGDTTGYGKQMQQHVGQSLLLIDLDGDSDKDALIGDVIQNNITETTNGGTSSTAMMVSQDTAFPYYSLAVAGFTLNVCDFLDINNDNKNDLIVSPFQPFVSDNFRSVWFYKNAGTTQIPIFNFQQDNYLQAEMIETGEGCYPVFFDYDFDGLQDMIIGNYGYYNPQIGNGFGADLSLYKNIGTPTAPAYQLITRDFAKLDSIVANNTSIAINNVMPTFGDLDGDGDIDMLLGNEDGRLLQFDNSAGPSNPCVFNFITNFYQSIDVGNVSAPQLVDMDRDGKLDLVIGNRNGKLSYYQNTGTSSVPVFTLVTSTFGGVDVTQTGHLTGFSTPCVIDSGGSYRLFCGSERGYVYFYGNIDGNLGGNFTMVDSMFWDIWEGQRCAPSVKDINGDGLFDMVLGNYAGGVSYFKGDLSAGMHELSAADVQFDVFPNPANGNVHFNIQTTARYKNAEFKIFNMLGSSVRATTLGADEKNFNMDVSTLPAGIYLCRLEMNGSYVVRKLIIER